MIRFSAFLVVAAVGTLIAGVVTSKLVLVYIAIGVSGVALLALGIGAVANWRELSGKAEAAPVAAVPAPAAPASVAVPPQPEPAAAAAPAAAGTAGGRSPAASGRSPAWSPPAWSGSSLAGYLDTGLAPSPATRSTGEAPTRWDLRADSIPVKEPVKEPEAKPEPAQDGDPDSPDQTLIFRAQPPAETGPADDHATASEPAPEPDPAPDVPASDVPASDVPADATVAADTTTAAGADADDEAEAKTDAEAETEAEAADPHADPHADQEVTVVPGVPRYHKPQCILIRFMGDSDLDKMTAAAAKQAGCTPCRACIPDLSGRA